MKYRSSHRSCSIRKCVLRNFTKFTGKHLYQSPFLNKVASLRPATLLKKGLWHRCFPMNFAKFLRTPFSQNTFGRLLLEIYQSFDNVYEMTSVFLDIMKAFDKVWHDGVLFTLKHNGINGQLLKGITKPCTHLHPAPPTSTQLISVSTQHSANTLNNI